MRAAMLAAERRGRIREVLRASETVTTLDLAEALGASAETIRRDLLAMERANDLVRVHGGATRVRSVVGQEPAFTERATSAPEAKQAIGTRAAGLVQHGSCIMIDVGTTALQLARALPTTMSCTVLTCSLLVAAELADHPGVEVIVSGGRLRAGDLALSGLATREFFSEIHPDIAFLGSGGIHETAGLTDFYLDEVGVRKAVIAGATQAYVLADSTKFDVVGRYHVAPFHQLTGIITEKRPPARLMDAITQHASSVLLP